MKKLEEYGFSKEESRQNILANKHDHITTTYYLILKRLIREGKTSVADLVSKEYFDFIGNPQNMLETWSKKMVDTPELKKGREEKDKSQNSMTFKEKVEESAVVLPATLLVKESNKSIIELKKET